RLGDGVYATLGIDVRGQNALDVLRFLGGRLILRYQREVVLFALEHVVRKDVQAVLDVAVHFRPKLRRSRRRSRRTRSSSTTARVALFATREAQAGQSQHPSAQHP